MKFIKKQIVKESVEEQKVESEVLNEAVNNNRTYTRFGVAQALDKVLNVNDAQFDKLETIIYDYTGSMKAGEVDKSSEELRAENVDELLDIICSPNGLNISDEQRDEIEQVIMNDKDNPMDDRKEEYNYDLDELKDFLNEESVLVSTYIIDELEEQLRELKNDPYFSIHKKVLKNKIIKDKFKEFIEELDNAGYVG